jgi:hypothetical protein
MALLPQPDYWENWTVRSATRGIAEKRNTISDMVKLPLDTTYRVIETPLTAKFWDSSKRELKAYGEWFHEVMPYRLAQLADSVQSFQNWQPDFTASSLDTLGRWLSTQVETRDRTEVERQRAAGPLPMGAVSSKELTVPTISLAFDVGMYVCQVLLRNHTSLKWDQPLSSKKFIDYGQPVLMGFRGNVPFNPVRTMTVLERGLADGSQTGRRLRELYDIWSEMVDHSEL